MAVAPTGQHVRRAVAARVEPCALQRDPVDPLVHDRPEGARLHVRLRIVREEHLDGGQPAAWGAVAQQKPLDGGAVVQRQRLQKGPAVDARRPAVLGRGLIVRVLFAPEVGEGGTVCPDGLVAGRVAAARREVDRLDWGPVVGQNLALRLPGGPTGGRGDHVFSPVYLRGRAVDVVVVPIEVLGGEEGVGPSHDRHGTGARPVVEAVLRGDDARNVVLQGHAVDELKAGAGVGGTKGEPARVRARRLGGQDERPAAPPGRREAERPGVQVGRPAPRVHVPLAAPERHGLVAGQPEDWGITAGKQHRERTAPRGQANRLDLRPVMQAHLYPVCAVGRRLGGGRRRGPNCNQPQH
ncbi:hypothetical protein SARU107417_14140 [Salinibacter ruber]